MAPLAVAVVTRLVVQFSVPALLSARSNTRPTGSLIEPSVMSSVPVEETLKAPVPVMVPSYQFTVPLTVRLPVPSSVPPSKSSVPLMVEAPEMFNEAPD